ncbi:MAG: ribosome silencing factor [Candidatus Izemoplasmatales bacterium]|jgi:ribosome-associated protein|nr:ribosome silencing factor [Candidatus Izemoplasmatales bacterium]NLF49020.1 ribosome silencing factor [Acholeplasmataceae bacterium]MDD4354909.1 ribosome silencing factor [Candidatus Izemoplasmatales bacterium]MDD4987269.1 ribosome silencing factor [Candidatus Izemoplasmatales bacterium]MDD5601494.1 ribosome silencing factor [Candidatus Izemoplasmatales bacterium]
MTERLGQVLKALQNCLLTDIRIYDFRGFSPFFDFQILASAQNERQVHAAISHLQEGLVDEKIDHIEGLESSRWLLFDLGDILLHVLHKEEREYYQFEKLFIGREEIQVGDGTL